MKFARVLPVILAAMFGPALALDIPNGLSQDGLGNVKVGGDIERVENSCTRNSVTTSMPITAARC